MAVTRELMLEQLERATSWKNPTAWDVLWGLLVVAGSGYAYTLYQPFMDGYEVAIQLIATLGLVAWGLYWKPARWFVLVATVLTVTGFWRYGTDFGVRKSDFLLKYFLESQAAFMWMSSLFVLATLAYFVALFGRSEFVGRTATALTWSAAVMGLTGLLVRWRESYLLGADIGHIPVSNLYEVFILFALVTALLYLFYEDRYRTRSMGGFALLVISAAVAFLLWYTFDRQAHHIQPLIPALQSYWMKIHVPANFIGYGAFALAAMLGTAYLVRSGAEARSPDGLLARVLPPSALLDEVMYKAIALGFAAFTIATVLGALWAAEAWGGYWSWDPKETWALIVWLNYAAWLHLRLTKGWRGAPMAWWAVIGLFVTLFAFLGVNMFLSGLHSYGSL
ncbi:MAG: c-type cytochrome biogenesis protein CcsB [Candidatus Competibacteraceae bacterium]|nr:c-type cytochrome biogenesis protein CcsB [Candidatus Competibacteraceae bacterium]MBK8962216.1 c-type cytochrome biogenesis protein CcsB [Candidatus Competibacteraceae bacterium]MBK9951433.1 c-type cytochrome biogenesis protein CcsB [Candidatus Competibacteraceae bacterium]